MGTCPWKIRIFIDIKMATTRIVGIFNKFFGRRQSLWTTFFITKSKIYFSKNSSLSAIITQNISKPNLVKNLWENVLSPNVSIFHSENFFIQLVPFSGTQYLLLSFLMTSLSSTSSIANLKIPTLNPNLLIPALKPFYSFYIFFYNKTLPIQTFTALKR